MNDNERYLHEAKTADKIDKPDYSILLCEFLSKMHT